MSSETSIVPVAQSELALTSDQAEFLPFAHHDDWAKLGPDEQSRIRERIQVLNSVKNSPRGKVAAMQEIVNQNRDRRGFGFSTIRSDYYAWRDSQWDWRILRHAYHHDTSLPQNFIAELQRRVLLQHRSRLQAMNEIREEWRAGRPVPGYGTWREWFARTYPDAQIPAGFCGDFPKAWGNSTLYQHMPSKAQYALATRGRAAAAKYVGGIVRDTSNLRPLELIVLDDFEPDTMSVYERRVVRSTGLVAMDVATRRTLAMGMKPRIEQDDGRQIAIVRADVQFLLKQVFTRWGVPVDYPMTVLVENASAAVTEDLESALTLCFHGQVRISRTNVLAHKTIGNGFIEKSGKAQEKSWLESSWNLTHNMAASLPGQKGSSYQVKPGDLEAKIAYANKLFGIEGLTDEQLAQLASPFMTFVQQAMAYSLIRDRMDRRVDHKMQGFDKLTEFRTGAGDEWKPFAKLGLLTADQQLQVELRERAESSVERWEKLASKCHFVKVPEFLLALLTFTPKKVALRNHAVSFSHIGTGYTFLDMRGDLQGLPDGTQFMSYFDDQAPARLFVTDLQGRPVTVLDRKGGALGKADIKDADAIGEAAKQMAQFYHSQIEGPVKELLAGERAQAETDRAHNDAKLIEWGLAKPKAISPAERTAENRNERDAGNRPRVKSLSRTLAQDQFAEPAGGRFVTAEAQAQAIATHAQALQQRADREEASLQAGMGNGLADLIQAPCTEPAVSAEIEPEPDESAGLSDLI